MSCSRCSIDHDKNNCPSEISFELEGSILYGRCGSVPIRPIDLEPLVKSGETDTNLSLDIAQRRLVYKAERDTDTVSVVDIANVTDIQDLRNVQYQVASSGDILSFDGTNGVWEAYTVPTGTIVTPVGVGADGNLVKDGSGGTPADPSAVPIGGTIDWFGNILSIPTSYRELNGQALSRSVYSDLFSILGTTYGAGDGSTTFNLPNTKGRDVKGYDPNDTQFSTIGQTGGAKTASLSSANNGPHTHTGTTSSNGNHSHSTNARWWQDAGGSGNYNMTSGGNGYARGLQAVTVNAAGAHTHGFTTASSGTGTPFSVLDPYIVGVKIMRVV